MVRPGEGLTGEKATSDGCNGRLGISPTALEELYRPRKLSRCRESTRYVLIGDGKNDKTNRFFEVGPAEEDKLSAWRKSHFGRDNTSLMDGHVDFADVIGISVDDWNCCCLLDCWKQASSLNVGPRASVVQRFPGAFGVETQRFLTENIDVISDFIQYYRFFRFYGIDFFPKIHHN